MSIAYLKKAAKTPETESGNAQSVVAEMLTTIEAGGEQSVRGVALVHQLGHERQALRGTRNQTLAQSG